MRTFYRSLMEEFEARIVDLRPREAYLAIRRTALDLARGGATILAQLQVPVVGNAGRRSPALLNDIQRGYSAHSRGGTKRRLGLPFAS